MIDLCRINRSYLESLTTAELVKMADTCGVDIPPGLDRIFIIEELLDIAADDEAGVVDAPESSLAEADFRESVPLPRQYNITFIDVMIRDPLWVFAYWEIKSYDKDVHEKAADFDGYHLKVSPWEVLPRKKTGGSTGHPTRFPAEHPTQFPAEDVFTVPVGSGDTAWYLGFPPRAGNDRVVYKVELCVVRGDEELVLALSRPFRLPKLFTPPSSEPGVAENALIRLSGVEEFRVLRSADRQSRLKNTIGRSTGGSSSSEGNRSVGLK